MPQIKVTIDDKIYKQLKKEAKDNFRTITNEINYRLQQSFTTPAPAPIIPTPTYIPHGVPGGIPVEPYKITLSADTTPTPATATKTKQEQHPEWFTPDGKRKVIGFDDEEEETEEEINHTPTITNDDEPEPEWDADRGGARPRVR